MFFSHVWATLEFLEFSLLSALLSTAFVACISEFGSWAFSSGLKLDCYFVFGTFWSYITIISCLFIERSCHRGRLLSQSITCPKDSFEGRMMSTGMCLCSSLKLLNTGRWCLLFSQMNLVCWKGDVWALHQLDGISTHLSGFLKPSSKLRLWVLI